MLDIREVYMDFDLDFDEVEELLKSNNLKIPKYIDRALGIYDNSKLVATGFLSSNIIKGLAIDKDYRGENLMTKLVTELFKEAKDKGYDSVKIYTKSEHKQKFESLGFRCIAKGESSVLLEKGRALEKYLEKLKSIKEDKEGSVIVMNANPFTKGHRYLIEKAAKESEILYILVVEEDRSYFSYSDRFKLIKEGCKDIKNIKLVGSGEYVISSSTFPSYFTKDSEFAREHASLDIDLFVRHIKDALNIKKRFVGEEKKCDLTSTYNQLMKEVLPKNGIELIEIERLEVDNIPISASLVRKYYEEGNFASLREVLEDNTYNFLKSLK